MYHRCHQLEFSQYMEKYIAHFRDMFTTKTKQLEFMGDLILSHCVMCSLKQVIPSPEPPSVPIATTLSLSPSPIPSNISIRNTLASNWSRDNSGFTGFSALLMKSQWGVDNPPHITMYIRLLTFRRLSCVIRSGLINVFQITVSYHSLCYWIQWMLVKLEWLLKRVLRLCMIGATFINVVCFSIALSLQKVPL